MKEHDATETEYLNGYADGKPKWISVDERLPYKDGDYFVITERGTITDLPFSTQYKAFNADSCCGTKFAIPVTHWMPMPEPPEENDKPMTNADRIRAMTDEELAVFMFSMVDCVSCENKLMNNGKLVFGEKRKTCTDKDYHAMCNGDGRKCEAVCLKWLQQPAEEDKQ